MKRIPLILLLAAALAGAPAWGPWSGPGDAHAAYRGQKVSLDFQDAPVRNIIQLLADVSGRNVVISDAVQGNITLKLKNVPWDQALDLVLKMNGLGMETEGNIIRINTLQNMARQRDEEGRAKATQVQAEDLITRVIPVHYTVASAMIDTLAKGDAKFLSTRGHISADERTNTLIIQDIESVIDRVVSLVRELDTPTPQVIIEARIVQVKPSFNRDLGIQWGGGYTRFGASNTISVNGAENSGALPDIAVNLPATGSVGTLGAVGVSFGRLIGSPISLDLRLSAGQSRGLTKIVSTPKVAVLDNQTAKIEQGESIPFQTVSQEGTQTVFHDANLSLEVTPHITGDGKVAMQIKVAKNLPGETRSSAGPSILRREAHTNVLLNDGETTVIGGIYERTTVDSKNSVPFLSSIPLVGLLFKSASNRDDVEELLVFITPRIVKQ
jgi:type IV pilus assembly protein PilQ